MSWLECVYNSLLTGFIFLNNTNYKLCVYQGILAGRNRRECQIKLLRKVKITLNLRIFFFSYCTVLTVNSRVQLKLFCIHIVDWT